MQNQTIRQSEPYKQKDYNLTIQNILYTSLKNGVVTSLKRNVCNVIFVLKSKTKSH